MYLKDLKINDRFLILGNPKLKNITYEVTNEVSNCTRGVWNHTFHKSESYPQYTKVKKL